MDVHYQPDDRALCLDRPAYCATENQLEVTCPKCVALMPLIPVAAKVDAVLARHERHYDLGGDEDADGSLQHGSIDWEAIRKEVGELLK